MISITSRIPRTELFSPLATVPLVKVCSVLLTKGFAVMILTVVKIKNIKLEIFNIILIGVLNYFYLNI
ncbi:hypothetical protein HERIO_2555 [Hepatospora eriocheir]|uniref:Uncharacterized protein n=1 Tax=Hepatospora eriocheir TaxID=1081669 RepID=A0A1X0Q6L3_9MICR|nr:hypothetical protein HERIO_2555 [Hepatospora eriocheir]